jgi:hypothetical protein
MATMTTLYRIRRKQLIVLIVSLLLASSFYFMPLSDRGDQPPVQIEQAQEPLSLPTIEQPRLPDPTPDATQLADRQAVVKSPLEETAGPNKQSPSAETLPPQQAPVTHPQQPGAASTPTPATVEYLSTRDFLIPPFPLQHRIIPAVQDNHF